MPLSDSALVSIVEAQEHIGGESAGDLERLTRAVNAAANYVELRTGRIASREFSNEVHDGSGCRDLVLVREPVTSVSAVAFLAAEWPVYWDPVDLSLYPVLVLTPARRRIAFRNLVFPRGFQNVRVTYEAGFGDAGGVAPMPDLLKELSLQIARKLYEEREDDRVASVTTQGGPTGSQVISYLNEALPKLTLDLLDGFRVRRF